MGMNTTRTGMRTVLAAAAAGALITGSAAGAMAAPTAKPAAKPGYMQVRMANVHNGTFELNSTTPVIVKAKVNVWDSVKGMQPDSVKITLAQYTAKGGELVKDGASVTSEMMITKAGIDKKSKNYYTAIDLSSLKTKVTSPVTLCLSKVELVGANAKEPPKRQVTKKYGTDCITVKNTPQAQ